MYVNYGQGQQNVDFWGLSPYDDNVQINNYKAQNGITYPCAGYQGGAAAAINIVISGQPFLGYPTWVVICPDRSFTFDVCFPPSITCFDPYFAACGPPMAADFIADQTQICETNFVQFTDQSIGNPTLWIWDFPGGNPSKTTKKNPLVEYPNAGQFDVSLTITNGIAGNTITKPNLIEVDPSPEVYAGLKGETCVNEHITVTDASSQNTSILLWQIVAGQGILENSQSISPTYIPAPEDAGTTVTLKLTVNGSGECASMNVESIKEIDIWQQPEVTLMPFDTICYQWDEYPLVGGYPEGGVYSGTGVIDNIFYPQIAGVGSHLITYQWVDLQTGCSNSAEEVIVVVICSGIWNGTELPIFNIYPNPTKGEFVVELVQSGNYELTITNIAGIKVFSAYLNESSTIKLDNVENGIYNVTIYDGKKSHTKKITIKK